MSESEPNMLQLTQSANGGPTNHPYPPPFPPPIQNPVYGAWMYPTVHLHKLINISFTAMVKRNCSTHFHFTHFTCCKGYFYIVV